MRRHLGYLIGISAVALAAAPANAAIIDYNVSGVFADGSLLSGSFSLDDQANSVFNQFSNVSLSVSGANGFTANQVSSVFFRTNGAVNGPITVSFREASANQLTLGFMADYTSSPAIRALRSTALITDGSQFRSFVSKAGTTINLTSGTVTPAMGAVPEPATWAMMLAGFGGIGFAMRRRARKVTTSVAFG